MSVTFVDARELMSGLYLGEPAVSSYLDFCGPSRRPNEKSPAGREDRLL
jgi:hypothetical protein